jgi:hypothetical protein
VTTCNKAGLERYAHRWLDGRSYWPAGTEFKFYTEGFKVDCPGKDFTELAEFSEWKAKHANYAPPGWQWNVVGYAHKVFAAADALYDHDGVGVWLDADCVTFRKVPDDLIEQQLSGAYLACYQRTGLYTETGMWIMDCRHPEHRAFLDEWRNWYFSERYKKLGQWHDCMTLDETIRAFVKAGKIKVHNLSGEHHKTMHPQAKTELGKYIDHCKGDRKTAGISPENKSRRVSA